MNELYVFLVCLALGAATRLLFLATNTLARRTGLLPVTVILDIATTAIPGAAFVCFVIFSGATLAPFMFAALGAGFLFAYLPTRKKLRR